MSQLTSHFVMLVDVFIQCKCIFDLVHYILRMFGGWILAYDNVYDTHICTFHSLNMK